jgi:hypothetical protein
MVSSERLKLEASRHRTCLLGWTFGAPSLADDSPLPQPVSRLAPAAPSRAFFVKSRRSMSRRKTDSSAKKLF